MKKIRAREREKKKEIVMRCKNNRQNPTRFTIENMIQRKEKKIGFVLMKEKLYIERKNSNEM